MNNLILGLDFRPDQVQISYYDREKGEPWPLPAVKVDGDFLMDPERIRGYIRLALDEVKKAFPGIGIRFVTVTGDGMDRHRAAVFKRALLETGLDSGSFCVLSHELSFIYCALSAKKEYWTRDVGMFEYDEKGLFYYHLEISWKTHPAGVRMSQVDLTAYLNGSEIAEGRNEEMDGKFCEAIDEAFGRRQLSTVYLMGPGFNYKADGSMWMTKSLSRLFQMKRKVFVGQNLYVNGACCFGYFRCGEGTHPDFRAMEADVVNRDIYLSTASRNTPGRMLLIPSGLPWYCCDGSRYAYVSGSDQIVIRVRDAVTGLEQKTALKLDPLPERPLKTCLMHFQTTFESESLCRVTVTDMGFGELYPASGLKWETTFDLNGIPDTKHTGAEARIVEQTVYEAKEGLMIASAGVKVYTLEELFWYMYEHTYSLDKRMFDEAMFLWLDTITGSHSMTLGLKNYLIGERPLRDLVRLMVTSLVYLDAQEIQTILSRLSMMEQQNPLEHDRMAADEYYNSGRYMAALKLYHHVTCQMTGEEAKVSDLFRAETWHNMGLAFLRLHDLSSATGCMKRAYQLTREPYYMKCVLRIALMAEDQDQVYAIGRDKGLSQDEISSEIAAFRGAEEKAAAAGYTPWDMERLTKEKSRYALP